MTEPRRTAASAPARGGAGKPMSSRPMLTRSLRDGAVFAGLVAVVGGLIGLAVSGNHGLLAGLLGAAVAFVFLGLTAVAMLVAGRLAKGDLTSPVFFGGFFVAWLLKLILFVVFALWLRSQPWLDGMVFFLTTIVAVLGSLLIDCLAYAKARVPYVSDVTLPGEEPGEAPTVQK